MTRLEEMFERLQRDNEGAFMPFLVIGDPDLKTCHALADGLLSAGADVLEFGFPFSDPPADGPVIQLADQRALSAGMTTRAGFEFLAALRERTDVPFTLLMYYNLILQYGVDAFYARAAEVGVDAILVADLPIEEAGPALAAARAHGIAPVMIVSELTTDARLKLLLEGAEGYLYVVARLGVTGVTGDRDETQTDLAALLTRLRGATPLPLLVGFGISEPDNVRSVLNAGADGAIVGSALVRLVETHLDDPIQMASTMESLARGLKTVTRMTQKPA